MTTSKWRDRSRKVIARVAAENPGLSGLELRKKISEAYPFGPRQYHPYQIWLSEVRQFLGTEKPRSKSVPAGACQYCAGAGCMFCQGAA